ncbi:histone-like nucleoid-structuring protein MvaT [Pseudomonas sp. NPDC096950]|uniref:histone-like nucleoid-structuring protein MvaT n=1 Tax=Pseudomonas sp. NPDC096950 TaxID=3364485 RepID=UPI00383B3770
MSLINEYRATEEAIKELQSRLQQLSENDSLKVEMEFEKKLRGLMGEYSKSLRDIIAILDPESSRGGRAKVVTGESKTRRARVEKIYTNPHNGEKVHTKGGNHKVLKDWKAQYGADVVETWVG